MWPVKSSLRAGITNVDDDGEDERKLVRVEARRGPVTVPLGPRAGNTPTRRLPDRDFPIIVSAGVDVDHVLQDLYSSLSELRSVSFGVLAFSVYTLW